MDARRMFVPWLQEKRVTYGDPRGDPRRFLGTRGTLIAYMELKSDEDIAHTARILLLFINLCWSILDIKECGDGKQCLGSWPWSSLCVWI